MAINSVEVVTQKEAERAFKELETKLRREFATVLADLGLITFVEINNEIVVIPTPALLKALGDDNPDDSDIFNQGSNHE